MPDDEVPKIAVEVTTPSLPPTTTAAQDLTLKGQRHINMILEYTQSVLAVVVTAAIVYTAVQKISSPELTNAFFLIIGFYYSKMGYANAGGVAPNKGN